MHLSVYKYMQIYMTCSTQFFTFSCSVVVLVQYGNCKNNKYFGIYLLYLRHRVSVWGATARHWRQGDSGLASCLATPKGVKWCLNLPDTYWTCCRNTVCWGPGLLSLPRKVNLNHKVGPLIQGSHHSMALPQTLRWDILKNISNSICICNNFELDNFPAFFKTFSFFTLSICPDFSLFQSLLDTVATSNTDLSQISST